MPTLEELIYREYKLYKQLPMRETREMKELQSQIWKLRLEKRKEDEKRDKPQDKK
jgi:hypothetical protein